VASQSSSGANRHREELERASWLMAVQPGVGALARNVSLAGVRRLHLTRIRYHGSTEPVGPSGARACSRTEHCWERLIPQPCRAYSDDHEGPMRTFNVVVERDPDTGVFVG
jgi:hypothetical protein